MRKFLKWCLIAVVLFPFASLNAQQISILDSSQAKTSFRGLSVVNDEIVWVSGSRGTVGRSNNGGKSWQWVNPAGYEWRDFRDIEAIDEKTAVIMAIDSPGIILRTIDGGATWQKTYENHEPGIFLDAMTFKDESNGICVGDPLKGRLVIISTRDGGASWESLPVIQRPAVAEGEALFAASGSNIASLQGLDPDFEYALVTGGTQSRLWKINAAESMHLPWNTPLPVQQGISTAGANSLAIRDGHIFIVGGNFAKPDHSDSNYAFSAGSGQQWSSFYTPFAGYKSSGIITKGGQLMACGLNGVEAAIGSMPGAPLFVHNWQRISMVSFHAMQQAKDGQTIYLAGGNGRIGKIVENE